MLYLRSTATDPLCRGGALRLSDLGLAVEKLGESEVLDPEAVGSLRAQYEAQAGARETHKRYAGREQEVVSAPPSLEGPLPSMEEIHSLIKAGDLSKAREQAFSRLNGLRDALQRREVESLLGKLHTDMVFSWTPMPANSFFPF